VSAQLRLTAQADAAAAARSADAQARHDQAGVSSATALARQMTVERERLEAGHARYEQWAADTQASREAAGKAKAELRRRGQPQPGPEPQPRPTGQPQTTTGSWRQFEADIQAVERAIARQHQAAIDAGQPWPPTARPSQRRRSRSTRQITRRRAWTSC
jgi:hypothetical protein